MKSSQYPLEYPTWSALETMREIGPTAGKKWTFKPDIQYTMHVKVSTLKWRMYMYTCSFLVC